MVRGLTNPIHDENNDGTPQHDRQASSHHNSPCRGQNVNGRILLSVMSCTTPRNKGAGVGFGSLKYGQALIG
jgi:hypothetical protein